MTGRIEVIDYHNITRMYGALHCSTQVLLRESGAPRAVPIKLNLFKEGHCFRETNPGSKRAQTTNSVLLVPPTGSKHKGSE